MDILPKLTSIFKTKFDFSKLKSIKASLQLHLFSDHQSPVINIDNRTVKINIGKVEKKHLPHVKKIIKGQLQEGHLLLEKGAKQTLDDFKNFESETQSNLLDFFKGKIPSADLEIFRASLYLRNVYKQGKSVEYLKRGIIERHGIRGKNICNLTTAGYFESTIKPLYEEMSSQQDFSNEKFLEHYEIIITQSAFAIFVNRTMTTTQLRTEILERMKFNKKYGVNYLNIHGIGYDNVQKIYEVLTKLKSKLSTPPEIDSGQGVITVKIKF